jgi:hypothetical protein
VNGTKRSQLTGTYTPPATGEYVLEIYNYRNATKSDCWNYIDDITLAPADSNFKTEDGNISCDTGGQVLLKLRAGWEHAGEAYMVLGSGGCFPGFDIDGVHVNLNKDTIFQYTLTNFNSGLLQGTFGTLDGLGWANATINMPGPVNPSFLGMHVSFEYLLLSGTGQRPVTFASDIVIVSFIP